LSAVITRAVLVHVKKDTTVIIRDVESTAVCSSVDTTGRRLLYSVFRTAVMESGVRVPPGGNKRACKKEGILLCSLYSSDGN
jgi:hypothetical protein